MMHRPNDHRSRSAKPLTIHGYAQSGDLLGFQKLLRDNPSLLNDTNPVVRSPFSSFFVFVFGSMCFFKFVGELGCDSCIVSINLEFEKFELWWVGQGMYFCCISLSRQSRMSLSKSRKKKKHCSFYYYSLFFGDLEMYLVGSM